MSSSIDISNVNKVNLLHALWEASAPAAFFTMNGITPPSWDEKLAKEACKGYIDYFQGRMIKTDISGLTADPYFYDRDCGEGAFENAVRSITNIFQYVKEEHLRTL